MTKAMLRENIERWGPRAFVIAALLMILFFLASLVIIYVGDEYVSPHGTSRASLRRGRIEENGSCVRMQHGGGRPGQRSRCRGCSAGRASARGWALDIRVRPHVSVEPATLALDVVVERDARTARCRFVSTRLSTTGAASLDSTAMPRTRSGIKWSQSNDTDESSTSAQLETLRSTTGDTKRAGSGARQRRRRHNATANLASQLSAGDALAGWNGTGLACCISMRKREQLPQMGDVLISKPTASRAHHVSVVPDAESVIQGPHDVAVAGGRDLAQRLGVDLWLAEDHIHFLRLATHRDDNEHHTPVRAG
jgi:hypothetical protein